MYDIDGQAVNSPRCSVVHQSEASYWLQAIGISLDLIRNNTRAPQATTVIGACYTINATCCGAFDCTDQVRQIVRTTLGVICNESKSARTRPLLASTCHANGYSVYYVNPTLKSVSDLYSPPGDTLLWRDVTFKFFQSQKVTITLINGKE